MITSDFARFEDKVMPEPNSGCWLWTAGCTTAGYGTLRIEGKPRYAHRLSYEHFVGPIPEGLNIDHLCRNTYCCNPAHLEPVTNRENTMRGKAGAKQRPMTHCPQGHPYEGDNLIYCTMGGRRARRCRECKNAGVRRQRATMNREEKTVRHTLANVKARERRRAMSPDEREALRAKWRAAYRAKMERIRGA